MSCCGKNWLDGPLGSLPSSSRLQPSVLLRLSHSLPRLRATLAPSSANHSANRLSDMTDITDSDSEPATTPSAQAFGFYTQTLCTSAQTTAPKRCESIPTTDQQQIFEVPGIVLSLQLPFIDYPLYVALLSCCSFFLLLFFLVAPFSTHHLGLFSHFTPAPHGSDTSN